jgi:hypothetical protein
MCGTVITVVRFRVERVPDKHAFDRTIINLRIVSVLNENKCATANLVEVRYVGFSSVPLLERSVS